MWCDVNCMRDHSRVLECGRWEWVGGAIKEEICSSNVGIYWWAKNQLDWYILNLIKVGSWIKPKQIRICIVQNCIQKKKKKELIRKKKKWMCVYECVCVWDRVILTLILTTYSTFSIKKSVWASYHRNDFDFCFFEFSLPLLMFN